MGIYLWHNNPALNAIIRLCNNVAMIKVGGICFISRGIIHPSVNSISVQHMLLFQPSRLMILNLVVANRVHWSPRYV